jgi:hypothetical protein
MPRRRKIGDCTIILSFIEPNGQGAVTFTLDMLRSYTEIAFFLERLKIVLVLNVITAA